MHQASTLNLKLCLMLGTPTPLARPWPEWPLISRDQGGLIPRDYCFCSLGTKTLLFLNVRKSLAPLGAKSFLKSIWCALTKKYWRYTHCFCFCIHFKMHQYILCYRVDFLWMWCHYLHFCKIGMHLFVNYFCFIEIMFILGKFFG